MISRDMDRIKGVSKLKRNFLINAICFVVWARIMFVTRINLSESGDSSLCELVTARPLHYTGTRVITDVSRARYLYL